MVTKDTVLVVDDEFDAIDPLIKALKHDGFEVHYAADGIQALDLVKKIPFNLILMDIMMPRLNGYETLERLREDEETAYIPVIFVTGHFNAEEIVKGLGSGAVDAISKPFHISEVIMRSKVRMAEAKLKRRYTAVTHFFSEAQEKEQSRRTGLFEFYDHAKTKIGDIYVEDGKVVYATSRDAIKDDAFLQLASTRHACYIFQDDVKTPTKSLSANITSLILEASKIIDELEAKEIRDDSQKRVLVIDPDRIPRILASRALKASGYNTMVTSTEEISAETVRKYNPDVIVVDHGHAELILNKIKNGMAPKNAAIIIYSDQDHLDQFDGMDHIGEFKIDAFISKTQIDQSLSHVVYQGLKKMA
ncbi:response regulator [bacterium]|nr:MAG: response regulator [bacterium]